MARPIKPATQAQREAADVAAAYLRLVIDYLKRADCPRALAKVRAARKSVEGARAHAHRRAWRTERAQA